MRTLFRRLALLGVLLPACQVEAQSHKLLRMPDMTQTDPNARLPDGGRNYCAPAAVSNSLIRLAGVDGYVHLLPEASDARECQFEICRILGAHDYMDSLDGTGVVGLTRGIRRYVSERGYRIAGLSYQGWRSHPPDVSTGVSIPEPDWLRDGLDGPSAVWLNIGWYDFDSRSNEYRRLGGHWVTLVGYGLDERQRPAPDVLILHDPAPRAGKRPSRQHVRPSVLRSGRLVGSTNGLPRSAEGYLRFDRGMKIKSSADVAILDGAVRLRLAPTPGP